MIRKSSLALSIHERVTLIFIESKFVTILHLDAAPWIGGDVVLSLLAGRTSRPRPRRRPHIQRRLGYALWCHAHHIPHVEHIGVVATGLCLLSKALLELVELSHEVQVGRNDGAVSAIGRKYVKCKIRCNLL